MENRSVDTYRCYLCAFLSPCSSTLMISGSRWAGSLGLSRYSKTFLPYLLLMTSSRDVRISWTGGNQARPEFNTVTSTFHTSSKWWLSPDIFTFLIPHHTHFYFLKSHWIFLNHMTSDSLRARPVWPAWCRPHSRTWPEEPGDQTPPVDQTFTLGSVLSTS